LPPAALNAFQIAKNLRNSEFSLNPIGNKRKRNGDDDEDGDSDDSDNSPDAKLAKTLQAEEDAKMDTFIDEQEHNTPRRARRAPRAIRPKIDFISDFTEDEDEDDFEPIVRARKTTTTFASSTSKKTTKLGSKKAKSYIPDSDESEFVASDDDKVSAIDSDSSDVPLATLSAIKKVVMQKMNDSMDEVVRQQSTSFRARGNTSRGRGRARGGSRLSLVRAGAASTSTSSTSNTKIEEAESSTAVLDAFDSLDSSAEELLPPFTDSDISETDDDARNLNLYERYQQKKLEKRAAMDRARLESHHPELLTMWKDLENLPAIKTRRAEQPTNISRELKPFQLEGLSWMQDMEKTEWGGGLLGDEMGMGKTIQAVSLIMSDYPAKNPSLVLIPPVALMQWQQEIGDYTDGTLKTFVFHGTNKNTKGMTLKELKKYDVILMSYNSLESMWRHQEKGFKRKEEVHFQKSVIHQLQFHRVILDEAHNIKTRTTGVAKACFALKADHKWCLSGTPLQNRIGEFFSLVRFLDIRPFACYFCKQCPCSTLEWSMNADNRCTGCSHSGMQHVSVFNQELLNPIQKHGSKGPGKIAFAKLRLLTDRFMLRRVKRDHSSAMELPAKEIQVDRQFFGEEENDFAGSIMNSGTRKFETYVAQGVLLNNYANIFGLIMQMRQVADHPDLILKKNGEGGQNILICCICDETAEEAIRSTCRHDFCRSCVRNYLKSSDETNTQPDCPQCHIPLSIDLEQPEMEQDQALVKKSSIINRIKMENWTSSSKIEALVHDLHSLRSRNSSSKSIIFSQFTTMLQLVEWRLRRAGITTVMLDGSMTPAQRQASINHFMTDVNVECFLVSLKAGGVALNLTEASKVFIVDP
jgi:DNA repair protein RAD16